jgi:hypothetical protein
MTGNLSTEEKLLSNSLSGQLVFKSGPVKPKLETVTLWQWSMASNAILYKMLDEGSILQGNILDYLSYTTKVYQLIGTHDMISVFFYDREYRKLQHKHKFRWGTDVPHLQTVFLKQKFVKNPRPQHSVSKPALGYASHTAQGKEICKKYNSRSGCNFTACKFDHVCSIPGCNQKHPAPSHPKN